MEGNQLALFLIMKGIQVLLCMYAKGAFHYGGIVIYDLKSLHCIKIKRVRRRQPDYFISVEENGVIPVGREAFTVGNG